MADDQKKENTNNTQGRDTVAGIVARWIVVGGVIYLVLMSVIFVLYLGPVFTTKSEINAAAINAWKDVVGFTVPVFAAWVGTILAFYFSKENFEAANRSVREMVGKLPTADKLRSISAKEVMIPRSSMQVLKLASGQLATTVLVDKNVLAKFTDVITRLPVMKADDSIFCIVHESTARKFVLQGLQATPPVVDTNLQQLLDDRQLGPLLLAAAFVAEDATLNDAQEAMKNKEKCQDVFVTKTGVATEPVLGWLTNADIAKAVEP